jgi:hypothetical protein
MDERLRNSECGQAVAKVGEFRSRLPQLVGWTVWCAKREQLSVIADPRTLELADQPQQPLGRLRSELIARGATTSGTAPGCRRAR